MQDTNITYRVTTVGIEQAEAKFNKLGATIKAVSVNQDGSVTATGQLTEAQTKQAQALNKSSAAQRNYFKHIAATTIQSAAINKLFLEFVDVSGQAIKQVDLMNNFPATMASMGESTKDSTEAFKALTNYVGSVGGNIADATSAVTRFTGVTKDVKASVAIFTGLNNALVAGDSSMEEQRLAAIQFAQAFERGKPDMREWLSLTQNMSFQLDQVAKSLGYVNANALGEALRNGEENMGTFTTELVKLSTGTGPIAKQAQARMTGMQFAFNQMKNAMVQGMAQIVNAFGRNNIAGFFRGVTQVIQVLVGWVITLMNVFVALFNVISRIFGGPQLSKITGDIAPNIKDGASAANDLGDNLGDAKDEAKELNKSLASFDKMNVLPDKTGKDKEDEGKGTTTFDPTQLNALGDAFGNIGAGFEKATLFAKIFAGLLTAIAANSLIKKIFDVNPINEFVKALSHPKKSFEDLKKTVDGLNKAYEKGLFKGVDDGNKIKDTGGKIGNALISGIAGAIGGATGVIGGALLGVLAPIGVAIAGFFGVTIAAGVGAAILAAGVIIAIVAAVVGVIYVIWRNWETIWGWIVTAYQASWDFIVALWQQLYDIFAAPIKWLLRVWEGTFIVIVAIIAIALEAMFKLVVGFVALVFIALKGVATWVFDNLIMPIVNDFKWMWEVITASFDFAWDYIFENILRPVYTWILTNLITPIVNGFRKMWQDITGFVTSFVNSVISFLTPLTTFISIHVINPIANLFSGLWGTITNGLSSMMNGLRSIFSGVSEIFKSPLNGIIDLLNKAIRGVNKLKVPDWVPTLGGKTPGLPELPRLAKGGIVDQATVAMVGESGKEAIVPLENNMEWVDKLAAKINTATGGSSNNGQPINLTIQIGEEKIVTKVIDLINEKTQMSGRNAILV